MKMSSPTLQNAQYNLFPFTKPVKNKYLGLISGLLRNLPLKEVFDDNSSFHLNGAIHDAISNNSEIKSPSRDRLNLLDQLCEDVKKIFNEERVVLDINIEPTDTLVLVGDVHGQFRDLQQNIFETQRSICKSDLTNSKDSIYLFLGDYVDRGPQGVEVISLLLALKVEYPNNVFMIRGNHEEAQICRMYGFLTECKAKLNVDYWEAFNQVFSLLPLAAVVNVNGIIEGVNKKVGTFFCCHGGLNPHTSNIEELQFLNRSEYGQGLLNPDDTEKIDGLLWSDPAEHSEYRVNMRGCGFTFGKDASEVFCQANNISFICRAHQMVMKGYQWDHEGLVLTLFSAPNYCGVNDNDGAIAIIKGEKQDGKKQNEPNGNVSNIVIDYVTYTCAPVELCTLYYGVDGDPVTHDVKLPPSPRLEASGPYF